VLINWISGATIISDGEYKSLLPSHIAIEKKTEDAYQLSFVSDINNRIVVNLNKKECEELSEKLKEIV
jgi:hypothetical protein